MAGNCRRVLENNMCENMRDTTQCCWKQCWCKKQSQLCMCRNILRKRRGSVLLVEFQRHQFHVHLIIHLQQICFTCFLEKFLCFLSYMVSSGAWCVALVDSSFDWPTAVPWSFYHPCSSLAPDATRAARLCPSYSTGMRSTEAKGTTVLLNTFISCHYPITKA